MEREDKVAFTGILIVLCASILGTMLGVKAVGTAVFGWFVAAGDGISFRQALMPGIGLGAALIVLFALVAGDGLLGELPTVLGGFLALTLFFTVSIAWVF